MKKLTEENSLYQNLEKMTTNDLLTCINHEDNKIANVIKKKIPTITKLVDVIVKKLSSNGRVFYIGSGTSGRLGILDASECPPTFGVSDNIVIGLIAGGDSAMRKAIETVEDNTKQAWEDLKKHNITKKDIVIGISASGTTPYVLGGLQRCQENKIYTACITSNMNMPINQFSNHSIVLLVGPEFVTGSTRMKAGTAQKMVLNMISTSVMIKLGHVLDNKMIDMQINNKKLKDRAIKIIINQCGVTKIQAKNLLKQFGSVRLVLNNNGHDK